MHLLSGIMAMVLKSSCMLSKSVWHLHIHDSEARCKSQHKGCLLAECDTVLEQLAVAASWKVLAASGRSRFCSQASCLWQCGVETCLFTPISTSRLALSASLHQDILRQGCEGRQAGCLLISGNRPGPACYGSILKGAGCSWKTSEDNCFPAACSWHF